MNTSRMNVGVSLAAAVVLGAIAVVVQAQQSEDVLLIEQRVDQDLYAAHSEVEVRSTINGDLVAAGRRVIVDGNVTGDIIAAAQEIEIRSQVNDDVRAAGQQVRVTSPVSGHLVAAGQIVSVTQDVGDWAWLAGNDVEVLGNVGRDLTIRAAKISINAEVAGDVELVGGQLELGPNAVVRGDLTWRSDNEAAISPEARIEGEFIEEPPPGLIEELSTASTYSLPLNVIVAVSVLFLLFSRPLRASSERLSAHPLWSLLVGLLVFCATPTLVVVLFFTGAGIWLGLTLFFIFLVVLLLGVLTGLFSASDILLRRFRPRPAVWQSLAAIFITVVAVGLIAKVPWLGTIMVAAIWLFGIGALCWNALATLRSFGQPKERGANLAVQSP